jgi:diguanylate cyclase (GGDEF)-like protein
MVLEPMNVLLVEDNPGYAALIRNWLGQRGGRRFHVDGAEMFHEAQTKLERGGVDLVLLDLSLPDSFGLDTVTRMHAAAPEVPIVVLTSLDDEEFGPRALQAGAEDYLLKGDVDGRALVRSLRYALERHRLRIELRRSSRQIEKSETKFRQLIRSAADGLLVVDPACVILFVNPAAARMLDKSREELRGSLFGLPLSGTARIESGGVLRTLEIELVDIEWEDRPARIVTLRDITEHKRAEARLAQLTTELQAANQRLQRLASIDPLTGMLNRRGLETVLAAEVQRMRRNGAPLAVCLLDCDDFKKVNDVLGHAAGDGVLKEIATRLKDSLRPTDHLARIGGDEFLMLLPDTRIAEAVQVAERLRLAVSDHALRLAGGPLRITASLGVVAAPLDLSSVEEILVETQHALKYSKGAGKNRVSQPAAATARAIDLVSDGVVAELRRVESFRAVRQAIVSTATEIVVGYEMLVRGPAGAFEMPRDLFRFALEKNLLTTVDLTCLEVCIAAGRAVAEVGDVHLNLFPSTLLDVPAEQLLERLRALEAPGRVCIEISEQQLIGEPAQLREAVRALREEGVRIAIDDVGFGRSSLEALILLEPDVVKIDPKFGQGVAHSESKQRALIKLVDIASALGCTLIAEGMQSRVDLEFVRSAGVELAQGFLWGCPE